MPCSPNTPLSSDPSFPESLDPVKLLGPVLPPGTPETRLIAVSTLNGSATTECGTSAQLGNETDSLLLQEVRNWADAIVVGSSTVCAENYAPHPDTAMVILSNSLTLPPDHRVLGGSTPTLLAVPDSTLQAPHFASRRSALHDAGAQFIACGDGSAASVVAALRNQEYARLAVEGGPSVYRSMLLGGQIDVLHLTFHPMLTCPVTLPILGTDGASGTMPLTLEHCAATSDGMIFARYRTPRV